MGARRLMMIMMMMMMVATIYVYTLVYNHDLDVDPDFDDDDYGDVGVAASPNSMWSFQFGPAIYNVEVRSGSIGL